VSVGFLLKADMIVGGGPIVILEPQHKPLYAIPDEERQIEQLALLG